MASAKSAAPTPVIRALDLGWGWTKYSHADQDGAIKYSAFPSLAPRHTGLDLSFSFMGRRDTKVVTVDGTAYEVGPDSADLDTTETSRSLNEHFILTEQYKACFYGALAYMGDASIDMLVVGLPLSGMQNAPKLKSLMEGVHRINADTTVEVKNCLVVPQPLGGLMYCMGQADSRPEFAGLAKETNLIIDPGFLTFDFLLTKGERLVDNRSGAHTGGVSKVLRALAESISAQQGVKYENLMAIDAGLKEQRVKVNGQLVELENHIRGTRAVLESSVNYMRNIVGDGSDIDNIILLGGGARLFHKTIKQFYPKHPLLTVDDAQKANVRGFQQAGMRMLQVQG